MASLVKDLDPPDVCAKCRLFEYSCLSSCKLLGVPLTWYEANISRHPDCPLIPVKIVSVSREEAQRLEGAGFEL